MKKRTLFLICVFCFAIGFNMIVSMDVYSDDTLVAYNTAEKQIQKERQKKINEGSSGTRVSTGNVKKVLETMKENLLVRRENEVRRQLRGHDQILEALDMKYFEKAGYPSMLWLYQRDKKGDIDTDELLINRYNRGLMEDLGKVAKSQEELVNELEKNILKPLFFTDAERPDGFTESKAYTLDAKQRFMRLDFMLDAMAAVLYWQFGSYNSAGTDALEFMDDLRKHVDNSKSLVDRFVVNNQMMTLVAEGLLSGNLVLAQQLLIESSNYLE